MAPLKRKLWSPTRQIVTLALAAAVSLSSVSLFHGLTLSDCAFFLDSNAVLPPLSMSPPPPHASQHNKASTSLAYVQSYGLIDDVSDKSWELIRKRAHEAHTFTSSDPQAEKERIEHDNPVEWYLGSRETDLTCPHATRVGGLDGNNAMWTCNVHRLVNRPLCLIYSFGSDGSYTWEDGLIDELGSSHCEVHVFDEQNHARIGDEQLKNIHFHQWGLKSSYHNGFNAEQTRNSHRGADPDRYTFLETRAKLGHENRTIDILRMDYNERKTAWTTYKDWVKADVRQILVSTLGAPFASGSIDSSNLQFQAGNFIAAFTAQNFGMFAKEAGKGGFAFSFVKLREAFWKKGDTDYRHMRQVFLPQIDIPEPRDTRYRIPRRIVYVYESNLFVVEEPVEQFFTVWHTVDKYRKAWNMSRADVWFVDDFTCLALIQGNKPELLPYFGAEKDVLRKQDICRVVAMYLSGGFYFNVDFEALWPYTPSDDASLVLARVEGRLSRRFMASEPRSPVMKAALDNILDAYRHNTTGNIDFDLGAEAIAKAADALSSAVHTDYAPLKEIGGNMLVPWIAPIPSVDLPFVNAIPESMRGPPRSDIRIPRRLIFTYKNNLLETKEPMLLYENVQHTIDVYRKAWDEPDAPVWFMDDDDCRSAIFAVRPGLISYFNREPQGSWRADICRVAALYLTGGYYFDVDMEAVNAWMPASNVSFSTAIDPHNARYFQSFLASEQKGRLMEDALDEMLLFYEKRKLRNKSFIGPDTLKWAVGSVPPSEVGETVILEEVAFALEDAESQQRRDAVGSGCHFKVQTPDTRETIFYSRAVGAGSSCYDRDSPEGQAYLKMHGP